MFKIGIAETCYFVIEIPVMLINGFLLISLHSLMRAVWLELKFANQLSRLCDYLSKVLVIAPDREEEISNKA